MQDLLTRLKDISKNFFEKTLDVSKEPCLVISKDGLFDVVKGLKEDRDIEAVLDCISGIDRPDQKVIEIVYHFWSYRNKTLFSLLVALDRDKPVVRSISSLFESASWFERETKELFGVEFEGLDVTDHLLLPDDWEGFPMRKDYQFPTSYHNITAFRPNLLERGAVFAKDKYGIEEKD